MSTHTPAEVADLVAAGHLVCSCGAVLLPAATSCRFCGAPISASTDAGAGAPAGSPSSRGASSTRRPTQRRNDLGSLSGLPDQTLMLVVTGDPVQQGSLRAVAPGVIRREDGPRLVAWRNRLTMEARRVCGPDWVAANAAVQVDMTFTVPRPSSAPTRRPVPADGYRDLDKLVRAVGDALCPSSREQFRVLASDMRITRETSTKTHPRPLHTDPWALDEPGVAVRVRPAVADPGPDDLPVSTHPVRSLL